MQTLLFLFKSEIKQQRYINADLYVASSPEPKGNRLPELGCDAHPSVKALTLFVGLFAVFNYERRELFLVIFIRNKRSQEIFIPWKVCFLFPYVYNLRDDGSVSVNRRLVPFVLERDKKILNPAEGEQSANRRISPQVFAARPSRAQVN